MHETPLLIVPPWINKFYILDLGPQKSFIRYMVGKGFTVFVVSWVNPDERLRDKTFEEYMTEGMLAATDAAKREAGREDQRHRLLRRRHAARHHARLSCGPWRGAVPSATFFAAQVDFTKAGDLLLFIDDAQLKALSEMMAERGFLDGSRMATVFNMLRPKDLIWPYIVNNYMLGKKPFPFDLLFWNQDFDADDARQPQLLPARVLPREQARRGQMTIGGVKLDLGKVKLPIYELCAKEDHIAPAKSVFIGSGCSVGRSPTCWRGLATSPASSIRPPG